MIIIDKDNIGQKASGNTTAKITLSHGLIYDYLINTFGEELAKQYFEANKDAIYNIRKIIEDENIECDFEEQSNFIFAENQEDVLKIQKEVEAINSLSKEKNYAKFVKTSELPFEIKGGIKIDNQAQFNPVKYMNVLAKRIQEMKGTIFTYSTVEDVKQENDEYITYCKNYKIKSKFLVMASHYPFINFPGMYFMKMYQVTSYAMAVETESKLFDGMYINAKEPTISFRTAKNNGKRLLIIGGGNHKTGYSPDSREFYGYDFLEEKLKSLNKDYKILYKWNTRDCVSLDKVPYIGEFSNAYKNMFIATGFNKWGMTTSNVSANIIADKILENENGYQDIFSSTRLKPVKNREELKNMTKQVVKSFVTTRIKIPKESISAIKNNNGGIIKVDGTPIGIYKNENRKNICSKSKLYTFRVLTYLE